MAEIVGCGMKSSPKRTSVAAPLAGEWRSPSGLSMTVRVVGASRDGYVFEGRVSSVPDGLKTHYPDWGAPCLEATAQGEGRYVGKFLDPSGKWIDAELVLTGAKMMAHHPTGKVSWQKIVRPVTPSPGSMDPPELDPRLREDGMDSPDGKVDAIRSVGGRDVVEPGRLLEMASAEARSLDAEAWLFLVAYKQGRPDGRFSNGTFVFHSPKLVRDGSRYNSFQVIVRDGRVDHVAQVELAPPSLALPESSPSRALEVAETWWLARWWEVHTDAHLDVTLRPKSQKDDFGPSVRWIWEVTGWGVKEDCTVLLDGETLKRLRVVINPAPEGAPPDPW
jgi:hypothetical protein